MTSKSSSTEFLEFNRHALLIIAQLLWLLLQPIYQTLRVVYRLYSQTVETALQVPAKVGSGKNVLVTTGRQAKTLHTVRALKAIGARVFVADYDIISASAISVCADGFILLPNLQTTPANEWLSFFEEVLINYEIDVVLPVSTINEVLMIGLAKSTMATRFPHISWICPDLAQSLHLDDRQRFSELCDQFDVPSPKSGVLTSIEGINSVAENFENGIILKRMESSVNREQEIVPFTKGDVLPHHLKPSESDAWQWQQFVKGVEKSAWYVAIDGEVTFSACYFSEADLTRFDPAPVPKILDDAVKRLLKGMNLTGQFAFDFIEDSKSGTPYVIECNPRASSVLETVSSTPLWGEAFFGKVVSENIVSRSVGFVFHRNCWPWNNRSDGHFTWYDPLPFLVAQIVWPLYGIASKGMTKRSYQKIDVNIGKIIVDGPSPSRNLQFFRNALQQLREKLVKQEGDEDSFNP